MNDIDFLTIEAMTNIGVILGITLLAIILIRTIVVGSLLKIAGKTDSIHDDAIISALKKPLTLIPIGIALFAIIQEINLDETYQSYAELIVKSYFYLAVFWSLADTLTPLRDFIGEKYDFLTPTLRSWIFRTLKFVAYLIGVVSVLELWGVDAASIIAGLGLFSVALALGAQNFFKNLIGGLLIIGEKRFKQGDWINIEGVAEGEVEKIDFKIDDYDKGKFKYFMHKEIHEQIDTISNTITGRAKKDRVYLNGLLEYWAQIKEADKIYITACGTSWLSLIHI